MSETTNTEQRNPDKPGNENQKEHFTGVSADLVQTDEVERESRSWLASFFDANLEHSNRQMLRQFYGNLIVLYALCEPPTTSLGRNIHARLLRILRHSELVRRAGEKAMSWQEAYAAEQLLIAVLPESVIRTELGRRYAEVCGLDARSESYYGKEHDRISEDMKAGDDLKKRAAAFDDARALIVRMLNDSQWRHSQKFQIRKESQRYYQRLIVTFFVVAAMFFGSLWLLPGYLAVSVVADALPVWRYTGFMYVLLAGFLGAAFSMLIRQQQVIEVRSIEAMLLISGFPMILLRLMVGAGAAAILYFFFETELIEGLVFPDLNQLGFAASSPVSNDSGNVLRFGSHVPNKDLSLLMVWGVIAGFSEKLVPTMLARMEKNGKQEGSSSGN